MVNRCNSPGTDIGKPVFMTDLQMHWYRLCDNILESNDTIQYNILGIENEKNRQIDKSNAAAVGGDEKYKLFVTY